MSPGANEMRCIVKRVNPSGDIRYQVRVVVGRRRVGLSCSSLEEAVQRRDVLLERAQRASQMRRERMARGTDKAEVIYFVQAGDSGPIKIGRTRDDLVERRLANLQIASYLELHLLGTIPGDSSGERELHRRLASLRIRGEWFEDSSQIRAIVANPPGWVCGSLGSTRHQEGSLYAGI